MLLSCVGSVSIKASIPYITNTIRPGRCLIVTRVLSLHVTNLTVVIRNLGRRST